MTTRSIAAVVIGRNEGPRLIACLNSLSGQVAQVVYVDSGSTDGSVDAARARGADVVLLDTSTPFSAARARNAGFERLNEAGAPDFVQFIDGDCIMLPGWVAQGAKALALDPGLALVTGHLRERHPERTVYNRLCDLEWAGPVGTIDRCGGIFLARCAAFAAASGFDPRFIAGEEPELCVRLRRADWRLERLDVPMAEHDAAMTRFSQWWRRSRRAGYAYALGAAAHGASPERHYVPELRRAVLWGAALPLLLLLAVPFVGPFVLLGALLYPLQLLRLWARDGDLVHAAFTVIGKFAEARGVLSYLYDRATGLVPKPIEYK